ncbi:ornithine carbamoyltransferase [Chania multitudinisentens RB-25]|uniref:Ornithine carbamoyltransferase n=1 Tax=Chania multitudinisentens RB-25 TaxID=1441930 RepID=W0LDY8_9GAMM|nr:SinI family autotransporter-associated protein [Chania multitudinisentens]AHG20609.2 ornithine carbamoyltransferase [Chania multitudinisentens RB-25]
MMSFALKKQGLALVVAMVGGSVSPVWAGSTPATASIQGSAPTLQAPSNGTMGAVDFSGTFANPDVLTTGDTLVMTYVYNDSDGDLDNSLTTVAWAYIDGISGRSVTIPATNIPASVIGAEGTSTIVIPAGAIGTTAISVTIQEYSATGAPISGNTITVTDTSEGGGGSVTPPGPIVPGGNVAGGIFLQSDNPTAGSGATDYARSATHPQVGVTYVFHAWDDANSNGVWDAGENDLTTTLSSIQWRLDGTNTAASGTSTSVTLSNHAITGATGDTYTVPVNGDSSSGATPGDQGFTLKVDFN